MKRDGFEIVNWTKHPEYLLPEERERKAKQRAALFQKLKDNHLFWSYDPSTVKEISDDMLIEMVLQYLDLDDICILFQLFPAKKIKQCWLTRLVPQGEYLFSLNRFIASYYFHAKRPGAYVKSMATKQLNK